MYTAKLLAKINSLLISCTTNTLPRISKIRWLLLDNESFCHFLSLFIVEKVAFLFSFPNVPWEKNKTKTCFSHPRPMMTPSVITLM